MGDVNTTAQIEFQNNIELQLQHKNSVLWDTCEEQQCSGSEKETVKDLIGEAEDQEADERHGDLKETDPGHDRVWIVKPNERYFNKFVDGADQLATKIGLTGGYTMAAMATMHRAWDSAILEGAYGPMLMGKDGITTQPLPSTMIVPVTLGGASGPQRMNVAKVRQAKLVLDQAFNEADDPRYMALSAVQADDLLSEVQATNGDYAKAFGVRLDADGNLIGLLGFNIKRIELRNPKLRAFKRGLTVTPGGYTRNPFWVRSGIRKGVWTKLRTMIKDQPQKVDTRNVFAGTTMAATRTQAGKVGYIENSEA
ncbi:phage capsid protein [uncultured Sphingomonas sp.]|uniref:phage capsid protein n=1 Tax=uncultured Sphingomonas sp. TaxID=158754 RepID=UPI0025DA66FD|nr:phage capsid protein [uncultured Sphingomonas sp.]